MTRYLPQAAAVVITWTVVNVLWLATLAPSFA